MKDDREHIGTTAGRARELYLPFVLALAVIALDQVTKMLIVASVPRIETSGYTMPVLGDFLRIIHTRNLGVAFSIGRGLPEVTRRIVFTVIPAVVLVGLIFYYVRERSFTRLQRWAIAGIIGGGFGNIIDRIFRPDGVVDFIDVKFYGFLGLERWPTFNVADASVVVCGILLMVAIILQPHDKPDTGSEDRGE